MKITDKMRLDFLLKNLRPLERTHWICIPGILREDAGTETRFDNTPWGKTPRRAIDAAIRANPKKGRNK